MNITRTSKIFIGLVLLSIGLITLLGCQPTPTFEGEPVAVTLEPTPVLSNVETAVATETTSPTDIPLPTETPVATNDTAKTEPTKPSKSTPTITSDAAKPESIAPDTAEPAIIYERTGGYAGLTDHWEIFADGRITNSNGREWAVDSTDVTQLHNEITALGFFSLESRYIPKNECCDRFTYSITVTSSTQTFTITALEQAKAAPDSLWTTLDLVQTFIAENTAN